MLQKCFLHFLLMLAFLLHPSFATPPKKIKIYMAAGLFNSRENHFNLIMNKQMEQRGYQTILPLRDGFEDKYFEITARKYMSRDEMTSAERQLVYLRDIGIFIPESDVILANLDEPLDDGVIVEISYAHMLGKPVIGYRTDVRTTYSGVEGISGIHSFVVMQCDYLITQYLPGADRKKMDRAIYILADKIDHIIREKLASPLVKQPAPVLSSGKFASIIDAAHTIIGNPAEMHTEAGMKKTVQRLLANKEKLQAASVSLL